MAEKEKETVQNQDKKVKEKKAELALPQTEIKEGAPFAVISYIFGLWILAFIFKKDNRFSLFHARQAVVIFFVQAVCLAFQFIPLVGILFTLIFFFSLLVSLYGMYLALRGQTKEIPVVGKLADKLAL